MADLPRLTLKCPQCGAPLPPESLETAATCAFCGMTSAPAVTAETPASPAAEGDAKAAATVEAGPHACPRCQRPLFPAETSGVTMMGCGGCGGIWLNNEASQHAVRTLDEAMADLADRAAANAIRPVSDAPTLGCPVCQQVMMRTQAPQAGIWIDVCALHGTWFDRFELGLVLDALKPRSMVVPVAYNGPVPDFREGANTELQSFGKILGYGVLGLLGGAAAVGGGVGRKSS